MHRLYALVLLALALGCGIPPPECNWDTDCERPDAAPCGSCYLQPDGGCAGYAHATCREHACISLCAPRGPK